MFYENFDITTMVTPVDPQKLLTLLNNTNYNHQETEFLVDGFTKGFDIGYRGKTTELKHTAPNLRFTIGNEIELWNKVMKEVKLKCYAGPFREIPYQNFIQSPIGLVPKDGGQATRLIFHLSYPREGASVNSCMPPELCQVRYPDFALAIRRCMEELSKAGEDGICYIAKSDMMSAFRNLGILPKQFAFLIMKARGPKDGKFYYFVHKSLPFGASISCSHFQRFSNAVAHIVATRTKKIPINYLDDYFFVALLRSYCDGQVKEFLDVCKLIGFSVSLEKTYWSSTMLTFFGLLINTVGRCVSIPADKVGRALELIENLLLKKKATVKELQRLTGFLNFLCWCVVPGRAFTRRFYNHFSSAMKPHHHINLSKDIKADLLVWQTFLKHPTVFCRPFMDFSEILTA